MFFENLTIFNFEFSYAAIYALLYADKGIFNELDIYLITKCALKMIQGGSVTYNKRVDKKMRERSECACLGMINDIIVFGIFSLYISH